MGFNIVFYGKLAVKALLHYALFHRRFSFYLAFFILPRDFPRLIPHVLDTNMSVSKPQVKNQEKSKKNARKIKNASPMQENVSFLHYGWAKT